MGWGTAEFIALPFLLAAYAVVLWSFWKIGSYENTGMIGWRRIPAGARLVLDFVNQDFLRWVARINRHSRK